MIKLNGIEIKPTIFPDKTSQVWQLDENIINCEGPNEVVWDFNHEGEIFHLCQLSSLLETYDIHKTLRMDYLPYGRQDKSIVNCNSFALNVFASIINNMAFDSVITVDAHSEVFMEMFNNSLNISPYQYIKHAIGQSLSTVLAFPDKGAFDRYHNMFPGMPCVHGIKKRDQISGNIEKLRLFNPDNIKLTDARVLMVDDICDGGRTFVMFAALLRREKTLYRNLYVTHGIFSKGIQVLKDSGIDDIFTMKGRIDE